MASIGLGVDPNTDPLYQRRPDRTLEDATSNIAQLSEEDRRKIYGLRTVFENTRERLQRLEQSNEEKDLAVGRERELRKNIEDKLWESQLVDMYGDPAVNDELHNRLPRSGRGHTLDGTPKTGKLNGKKHRKKKGSRSDDDYSSEEDGRPHKHHTFPGMLHPSQYSMFYPPAAGFYGYPGGMFPPQGNMHSTPNNAQGSSTPFGFPLFGQPGLNQTGGGNPQTSERQQQQGGMASGTANGEGKDEMIGIHAASILSSDSQARQIARLLQEIDLLKDQNRRLSEDLAEQLAECDKLKVEKDLRSAETEEKISSRASVLVQEIYQKQKQRDSAMMGRLKLANEERDKALMMMNASRQGLQITDVLSDDEDGLNKSADALSRVMSPTHLLNQTSDMLEAIHGVQCKQRERSTGQLEQITAQKEHANQKARQLEAELLRVRRELEETTPAQEEIARIRNKLSLTQSERDSALTKLHKAEEEVETLKIYYGLHKSLSKEQSLRDQYNNSLDQMQEILKHREGHVIEAQKETNKLNAIIQEVTAERDVLAQDIEKLQSTHEDQMRQNGKLQRQVNVLQRKLKRNAVEQGTV